MQDRRRRGDFLVSTEYRASSLGGKGWPGLGTATITGTKATMDIDRQRIAAVRAPRGLDAIPARRRRWRGHMEAMRRALVAANCRDAGDGYRDG